MTDLAKQRLVKALRDHNWNHPPGEPHLFIPGFSDQEHGGSYACRRGQGHPGGNNFIFSADAYTGRNVRVIQWRGCTAIIPICPICAAKALHWRIDDGLVQSRDVVDKTVYEFTRKMRAQFFIEDGLPYLESKRRFPERAQTLRADLPNPELPMMA